MPIYYIDEVIEFKSFKVLDRWHIGTIEDFFSTREGVRYLIKTSLTGIHSEVFRFENDIRKVKKK